MGVLLGRHPARLLWASGGHPRGQSSTHLGQAGALGPLCRAGRSPGAGRGTADLRGDGGLGELGESERIGGFSVQSRPPVRFAPPRPNALGRRGGLLFSYKDARASS
eukprot:scaffold1147_cov125-Isochrysis_galbana.AAC.12